MQTFGGYATNRAYLERIPGGLAAGRRPSDFDPRELHKGMLVEMEHTSDPSVAREIAMDHLVEDPQYYEKLELMEEGALNRFIANPMSAFEPNGGVAQLAGLIALVSSAAGAYHGYRRHEADPHPVLWALWWGLVSGPFWFAAMPIAFAQGYAKPHPT